MGIVGLGIVGRYAVSQGKGKSGKMMGVYMNEALYESLRPQCGSRIGSQRAQG